MSLSTKRVVVLICMDVLLVAELTFAFARSFSTTGDFSETFLHCYVPLFLPTILVSWFFLRRIKKLEKAATDAMHETALGS